MEADALMAWIVENLQVHKGPFPGGGAWARDL